MWPNLSLTLSRSPSIADYDFVRPPVPVEEHDVAPPVPVEENDVAPPVEEATKRICETIHQTSGCLSFEGSLKRTSGFFSEQGAVFVTQQFEQRTLLETINLFIRDPSRSLIRFTPQQKATSVRDFFDKTRLFWSNGFSNYFVKNCEYKQAKHGTTFLDGLIAHYSYTQGTMLMIRWVMGLCRFSMDLEVLSPEDENC